MNRLELAKKAVTAVVGISTSSVVSSIIKNSLRPQNLTEQVEVAVGSTVIGMMVADASKKYTNAKIDEISSWWKENVTKTEQ